VTGFEGLSVTSAALLVVIKSLMVLLVVFFIDGAFEEDSTDE